MKPLWIGAILAGALSGCNASNQITYEITGDAIHAPLSQSAPDPIKGEQIFMARTGGHCVLCHQIARSKTEFQGNIGPDLSHVAQRLSSGQIRLRIVDYEKVTPGVLMPSYFRTEDLSQVEAHSRGKTLLSAQDIEDIIAYLESLNPVENP